MSFLSALRVALGALLVHKGRSVLTSLGIVIGISAVIAMVSVGEGARFLLEDRLDSLGKNPILMRPGTRTAQGMVADFEPLTAEDVRLLRQRLGHELVAIAPSQTTQRLVSTPTAHHGTSIVGCTHDLEFVRGWQMQAGRFISAEDVKKMAPVCIIGLTVQKKLFPHARSVVGKTLRVERLDLRIIGVMDSKGRSPTGADQDDQVFMPLTTLQHKLVGEERLNLILTSTRSESEIEKAKADIMRVLRASHHVKPGSETFDVN